MNYKLLSGNPRPSGYCIGVCLFLAFMLGGHILKRMILWPDYVRAVSGVNYETDGITL